MILGLLGSPWGVRSLEWLSHSDSVATRGPGHNRRALLLLIRDRAHLGMEAGVSLELRGPGLPPAGGGWCGKPGGSGQASRQLSTQWVRMVTTSVGRH